MRTKSCRSGYDGFSIVCKVRGIYQKLPFVQRPFLGRWQTDRYYRDAGVRKHPFGRKCSAASAPIADAKKTGWLPPAGPFLALILFMRR